MLLRYRKPKGGGNGQGDGYRRSRGKRHPESVCRALRVQVPVVNGDNATAVATAIKEAVNGVITLPFTASSDAGVVTLTARHKGLYGNELPVCLNYYGSGGGEILPAGLQVVTEAGTAGSGAPDLTAAVCRYGR